MADSLYEYHIYSALIETIQPYASSCCLAPQNIISLVEVIKIQKNFDIEYKRKSSNIYYWKEQQPLVMNALISTVYVTHGKLLFY